MERLERHALAALATGADVEPEKVLEDFYAFLEAEPKGSGDPQRVDDLSSLGLR